MTKRNEQQADGSGSASEQRSPKEQRFGHETDSADVSLWQSVECTPDLASGFLDLRSAEKRRRHADRSGSGE